MKIKNILISQPQPQNSSPYTEIISKYGVNIDFRPFFKMEPLTAKEFRTQKINILDFSAIVFTARTTIDAFFHLCEELRVAVPETMKYFCVSEAIAFYLQKYIVYRKRKIFFGNGTQSSIIDAIGTKHKDEKFLIATADNNKNDVHKLFSKTRFKFDSAVFVKTTNNDLSDLTLSKYQMTVFYSPSDVKSLLENFPDFKQGDLQIATFGPATAKAVKEAGLEIAIMAPSPQVPSIAKALELYLEKK
ncbi:MAG: uroporphyrinogen-III synthase [Bacteroidetes bacterium]|uniref:Uroporphyrinogen-III synthase n=1 Tax=Candidatus Egerieousia excrementavium TaxID=2840778 RepID=A0A9D9GYM4_9BACT|nr:uroporphyrinogen-III synthase [Candidatus Egerieousia excrementavium]